MEIQTRSHTGEIRVFCSFDEAFKYADSDSDVWKISWTDVGIPMTRIRLVKVIGGGWTYEPIL